MDLFSNFRLICDENLRFNFKFSVKEAGPLYQPKIDPNSLTFDEVNDDCILHIMSYLDLLDIVNLGKTSSRFQSVARELYGRKKHFSFNTNTGDSSINEVNLPIILKEIGSNIRSIEWHGLSASHLDILAKYCSNVTRMKFCNMSTDVYSLSFKKNKTFFEKLKRMHIDNAKIFDSSVKPMISQSKLISLKFERCQNIRGNFLTKRNSNKLKHIKVSNCRHFLYGEGGIEGIDEITLFQRNNQLVTFSIDTCCSYLHCLTSESEILATLEELELDFSCFSGNDLDKLKFKDLKRLKRLTMTLKNITIHPNLNTLFFAMGQVDTLESLNVDYIQIDDKTIMCLGSIKNLKKLRMNKIKNTTAQRLYTDICSNLPNLTELSISFKFGVVEKDQGNLICDMIRRLPNLSYFSLSSSTWELLNMILQVQLPRARLPIKIGISQSLFDDPRKVILHEYNSIKYVQALLYLIQS